MTKSVTPCPSLLANRFASLSNTVDMSSSLDEDAFVYEVEFYVTPEGRNLYLDWARSLRDPKARIAANRRIGRMREGNFGDHKYLRDGVSELRMTTGPGYRIYYGLRNERVVILLCAGDKGSQDRHIDRAVACWKKLEEETG